MGIAIRLALVWLTLLVTPLQAFAVGSSSGCSDRVMPTDGAPPAAAPTSTQCHGVMSSPVWATPCDHSTGTVSHCPLSAACSLVAAPGLQWPDVIAVEPGPAPARARGQPEFAFCTGAPERPPRTLA